MKELCNTFLKYLKELENRLNKLIELNYSKKEILLSGNQVNKLIDNINREENLGREFSSIQKKINFFFKNECAHLNIKAFNITQFLNCIVDYNEEYEKIKKYRDIINKKLSSYRHIKQINMTLLKTEVDYYGFLFNNLKKKTSFKKESKHNINLCNTTA
ncbi:MAG: hypothetical protein ACQESP_05705 [Candidatus Muiribacteriota bacterium]